MPSPALAHHDPDAALIALGVRFRKARAEALAAWSAADEAAGRAATAYPPRPDALRWRTGEMGASESLDGYMSGGDVNRWRRILAPNAERPCWMTRAEHDRQVARARAVVEAYDAHSAACEAVEREHHIRELERRAGLLDDATEAVMRLIMDAPASTLAGFKVKAEVVAGEMGESTGEFSDALQRRFLAELLGRDAPAHLAPAEGEARR